MKPTCINVIHIAVEADKGACLAESVRDALLLALAENRIVVLEFNQQQYKFDPSYVVSKAIDGTRQTR